MVGAGVRLGLKVDRGGEGEGGMDMEVDEDEDNRGEARGVGGEDTERPPW